MNFRVVILLFLIAFHSLGAGSIFYNGVLSLSQEIEVVLPVEGEYVYTEIESLISNPQFSEKFFKPVSFDSCITLCEKSCIVFYPSHLFIRYHKLVI